MAEIIAEPTALSKVIALKFKINDVDVPKTTQLSTNKQFNTTDTDAWFTFELDGLAATNGTYDLTLINLDDKSIFHHDHVLFPTLPFHYKLNSSEDVTLNEIRHAGRWLGQLVVTLSNGDTTARRFGFDIAGHILDGQDAQVILLSDYQALINTINLAKDELTQYNIDFAALIADVMTAEGVREQAEIDRAATFDALVESEMVAQNVATKLTEKEATFAPRMLSLESELAETNAGLSSIEHGNSEEVLNNLNYLGNHQNIHPKVLYFSTPWNGYKYWMAYTPYPSGDTSAENPCIAVSNDMLNWTVPAGLVNPLDLAPESGYNSDTHLLYRSDTGVMEIWWRQYNGSDGSRVIYRRTSTDGVTWTAKETIFTLTAATEILSPVVMFEEGKYKVWGVRGNSVIYRESVGDSTSVWSAVRDLNIEWESQNLRPWHLDIIHTDLGYEMIVCAYDVDTGSNNDADLFYVLQKGESFTIPEMVLKRSENPTANANKSIYRASFIKVNDVYYVFYSFVNLDSTRGMSLSIGRNMLGLNGFRNFKRTIPRAGERTVTITSNAPLTDYNVTGVDALFINQTAGEVTINSFVGGYVGQELKVILNSSVAKARFKPSNRLLLPSQNEFLAEDTNQQVVNLVCTNGHLTLNAWRVEVNLPVKKSHILTAGATATGLNVMNIDAIWIAGAGVTIESLVGGYAGKVVHIYCSSGSASATLVESANLRLPGGTNLVLTAARMGVTAICRNPVSNEWRVF